MAAAFKLRGSFWFRAGLTGLGLIGLAAALGIVPRYLFGEEFLLFRYADGYNHELAWQMYYQDNGRAIEALYWNYLYKLVGYQPLLIHTLSFVLLLVVALLATRLLSRIWPNERRPKYLFALLAFVLFTNWISLPLAFKVSTDNGRISLIFFFLAGLALQNWAAGKKARWLIASFLLFVLSIITYENALLLFPGLLLLAWPLERDKRRGRAWQYLGLAVLSGVFGLLLFRFYAAQAAQASEAMAHPAVNLGAAWEIVQRIAERLPGYFFGIRTPSWSAPQAIWLALMLAAVILLQLFGLGLLLSQARRGVPQPRRFFLAAALIWFFIFGFVPYAAAGYGPVGRVFSSSVFGLMPLGVLAYHLAKPGVWRVLAAAVLAVLVSYSGVESTARYQFLAERELPENVLYRGLLEVVPQVQPGTVFIFIDRVLSNSGCGPSLEMLYGQPDLLCAFLSTDLAEYWAIRHEGYLEANRGGNLRKDNWILIALDAQGLPYVVEQLTPGADRGLQITWEDPTPIRTNREHIVPGPKPASRFYLNLLQRAPQLGARP